MSSNCAFLGLGVMGGPMAEHLVKAGHKVAVWNRTQDKARQWAEASEGGVAKPLEEVVASAEYIFMCLGDDPDVRSVFRQMEPSLRAGMTLVDHTTGSADLARELGDRCAQIGAGFLDAPVSGGQAGAENGQLTVMVGGEADVLGKVQPIMQAYSKQITHIGGAGAGQLAKSVNQICIAGIVQGLAEGLHFAEQAGVDPAKVIEAISQGAAQSWQMENRWKTMVADEYEFGFAVDWMRKDLRIALEAARRNGARLPMTAAVDQFYGDVQAMGGGRWDTSSLKARFERGGDDAED